jgi:hypothetical protein
VMWPFGTKREHGPSAEAKQLHDESLAVLRRAHGLRMEAAEVGSSLRESRLQNHFAEGFRTAMGGTP